MRMIAASLCLLLAGCATGYQASGFGGGFTDMPMSADTVRISYRGNAFTSPQQTQEMAMLRGAELAIDAGYTHFIVVGAGDSTDRSYYTQTGTQNTTITPTGFNSYQATTNTYGGYTVPIDKPISSIVVKFVREGEGGLSATSVLEELGPKYIR